MGGTLIEFLRSIREKCHSNSLVDLCVLLKSADG